MKNEYVEERMEYIRGRYHALEEQLAHSASQIGEIVWEMSLCRKEWGELNESNEAKGRQI